MINSSRNWFSVKICDFYYHIYNRHNSKFNPRMALYDADYCSLVKSFLPMAFCAEEKVQLSVPVQSRSPSASNCTNTYCTANVHKTVVSDGTGGTVQISISKQLYKYKLSNCTKWFNYIIIVYSAHPHQQTYPHLCKKRTVHEIE